ncbi:MULTISPECIES: cytochrome b [Pseudomonas]|uniref:cytochrome b n=1 Tax=Pseudomonadaceae TaxID=135621 RepID=UPI000404B6C6|nr:MULTISPECIES: cytochrome b/b6 domain-containing protein [Pseudomonas]MDE3737352.1 cytochrome b/b6 domain-containing protein [Pseudomonas resinovorans]
MTSERYSKPRRLLHWCFAAVIIWATATGFFNSLTHLPESVENAIAFINVSLTALLIPLFALRLYYVLAHPAPHGPTHESRSAHLLAQAGHLALYVTMAVVLLTGVLMMDRPISVFDLLVLPQPLSEPVLIEFFDEIHRYSCIALALLVIGHVAAVAVHQMRGHGVLRRMAL